MPKDDAVPNPPAGGPQDQASTNDQNINSVLNTAPWVVAISAHGQVGVHSRYTDETSAKAAAAGIKANRPQSFVEVTVVKENDPSSGLPALVADVEAAEAGADAPKTPAKASANK